MTRFVRRYRSAAPGRRLADTALKYWPLILGTVAVLGAATNGIRTYQHHLDDDETIKQTVADLKKAREADAALLQRVNILENVTVSEHPAYSAAIYTR